MFPHTVDGGLVELLAAWLRGEFDTTREQSCDMMRVLSLAGPNLPDAAVDPDT